jgi:hypothetical protein
MNVFDDNYVSECECRPHAGMTLGLITLLTAAPSFTSQAAETIGAFSLAEMQ